MDKITATKILAKEFGEKEGRLVVAEDAYKEQLLKGALSVYQSGQPWKIIGWKDEGELTEEYKSSLEYSNYIFLDKLYPAQESYYPEFIITPYALIGEKEEQDFRRLFYKNVPPDILHASDILGITHFINLYEKYVESSFYEILEGLDFVKNFIDLAPQLSYDDDDEIKIDDFENKFGSVDLLNQRFKKMGSKAHITKGTGNSSYIEKCIILKTLEDLRSKEGIKKHTDDELLNEFVDFVFTLPYEDQNIEVNKEILKRTSNIEFVVSILSREYTNSDTFHFQEYFDILDEDVREKVIKNLKLGSPNPHHDIFLWNKGFKDLEMDCLRLYREDADGFIEYFKEKEHKKKKLILEDILKCEHMNQKVIDWIDANEPELLKEASFNG